MINKSEYKFSVLLSVYYKENPLYLEKSIDSIYENTLPPTETVLVEDGKLTEELDKMILKLCKKYESLKIVKYEINRGLGMALSDGIKECSYDIIARMDTDDICHKDRFEKQITYMYQNTQVSVLGSNITEYDNDMKQKLSIRRVPCDDKNIKKYIKKRNPFNHMSVVFRKSAVLASGNYMPMLYFEDYYLWCRMTLNNCKFSNINESLIDVRGGIDMVSRRGGIKYARCLTRFEKKIWNLKVINFREFIFNVFTRTIVSLLPNRLRGYIYRKKLRS